MFAALRFFVTKQPVAFGICVAALVFVLFFGIKFLTNFVWMQDPAHRNQALEGWMRPRYVSMSYHIPPEILRDGLMMGPPPEGKEKERVTMADIAAELGVSLEELTARVTVVAEEFHASKGRGGHKTKDGDDKGDGQ